MKDLFYLFFILPFEYMPLDYLVSEAIQILLLIGFLWFVIYFARKIRKKMDRIALEKDKKTEQLEQKVKALEDKLNPPAHP
jgi:hypothetical protein